MKKRLLSLLLLPAFAASAQDMPAPGVAARTSGPTTYKNIRLGLYIAPTSSWMRPTANQDDAGNYNVSNNGSIVGFMYGLMAEFYFAENYAITTGLQVNHTGGQILATSVSDNTSDNQVRTADFTYHLQYLEIPLNVKLRTYGLGTTGLRVFGQVGLTAGFNIGKKVDYTVNYYDHDAGTLETATGDHVKLTGTLTTAPVMLQMNLGAGIEYPVGNGMALYAGLFFNNGFLPDATNPDKYDAGRLGYKGSFKDGNTRLNNLALRVGIYF